MIASVKLAATCDAFSLLSRMTEAGGCGPVSNEDTLGFGGASKENECGEVQVGDAGIEPEELNRGI